MAAAVRAGHALRALSFSCGSALLPLVVAHAHGHPHAYAAGDGDALLPLLEPEDAFAAMHAAQGFAGMVDLVAVAVSALLTVSAAAVAAQPLLLLLLLAMAPSSSSSSSRWSSSAWPWSRWSAARALSLLRGVCTLLLAAAALNAATLQQLLWSRFRHAPLGRSHSAAAHSAARPDHLRAGLLSMEARRTISEVQTVDLQAQAWTRQMAAAEWTVAIVVTAHAIKALRRAYDQHAKDAPAPLSYPAAPPRTARVGRLNSAVLRVVAEWLASCWLLAFAGPDLALALFVCSQCSHARGPTRASSASIHPAPLPSSADDQKALAPEGPQQQRPLKTEPVGCRPSTDFAASSGPVPLPSPTPVEAELLAPSALDSSVQPSLFVHRLLRALTHPWLACACMLASVGWQALLSWSLLPRLLAAESEAVQPTLFALWWRVWTSDNPVLAHHARAVTLVLALAVAHIIVQAAKQRRPIFLAASVVLVAFLAQAVQHVHVPLAGLLGLGLLLWPGSAAEPGSDPRVCDSQTRKTAPLSSCLHPESVKAVQPAVADAATSYPQPARPVPASAILHSDPLVSLCRTSLSYALASQFVVIVAAHELEPALNSVGRHLLMALLTAAAHAFLFGATDRFLMRRGDDDDDETRASATAAPRRLAHVLSLRLRWPGGSTIRALLLAVFAIVTVLLSRAADYPLALSWTHNNVLEAADEILLPTSLLPLPPIGHADTVYAVLWAVFVGLPLLVAARLLWDACACTACCCRRARAPEVPLAPAPVRAASLLSSLLLLACVVFGSGPLVHERWHRRDCHLGPGEEDASMHLTPLQEDALRQGVELMAARLRSQDAAAAADPATTAGTASGGHRSQHEKSHGCLHAELQLASFIPPQFRHGIFDPHRASDSSPSGSNRTTPSSPSYSALVRFAQGGFNPDSDAAINVHSLALKLLNVSGDKVLAPSELDAGEADSQDLLLVTSPTFFASDARDMAELMDVLLAADASATLRFLMPSWRPSSWRWHIVSGIARMMWTGGFERSLLAATYFSAVPSRLGPHTSAVKYQLQPMPCEETEARMEARWAAAEGSAAEHSATSEADGARSFLREGLLRRLDSEVGAGWAACFALRVQPQSDSCRNRLEDAQTAWQGDWVQLATLRIPKQRVGDAAREAQCAQRSFNPWHALVEHRPLGSIQNGRRVAYAAAVQRRRKDAAEDHGTALSAGSANATRALSSSMATYTRQQLFRHGAVDAALLTAESRALERDAAGDVAAYAFRRDLGAVESAVSEQQSATSASAPVPAAALPSSLSVTPWWEGWSWRHWLAFLAHSVYFQTASLCASLTAQSQPLLQRLTDYRRIFQPLDTRAWLNHSVVPHFPPPTTGSFERWRDDQFFAQQFLTGPVPDIIVRCNSSDDQLACLPLHLLRTLASDPQKARDIATDLEAADADDPARTLVDLARASRLYVVDLSDELADAVTRPGSVLYAPVIVLYAHHRTLRLRPLLIQLESRVGARLYSPTSARTPAWVWHFAKMHALHSLGNYGGMVSHLLLAHLLLEPVIIAFHRQMSPAHPLRALLSDHFAHTFAVNQLGRRTLLNTHHPWFDQVFSLGLHGSLQLMRSHAHRHPFLQSDFASDMRRRGFHEFADDDHQAARDGDDDSESEDGDDGPMEDDARGASGLNRTDSSSTPLLAHYFYAEDGRLLRASLSRLLWSVLQCPDVYGATLSADGSRVVQSSSSKIAADAELHAWLRESALTPVSGVAGSAPPMRTLRSLHALLLHLVFTCSAQHAAVSLPQYVSYSFPPFWPLILTRAMPAGEEAERAFGERHIVRALASYRQLRETLLMMAVLSRPAVHGRDLCRGRCTTRLQEGPQIDACEGEYGHGHGHGYARPDNPHGVAGQSSANQSVIAAVSVVSTWPAQLPLPYGVELGAFVSEMQSLQCTLLRRNHALGPDAYRALLPSEVAMSVEA